MKLRLEELGRRQTGGGQVQCLEDGRWILSLPAGQGGYRWAQLDDYWELARRRFKWQNPFQFEIQARVSDRNLPGTWGFGFWNDPFSMRLGINGAARWLPALPEAAWFFHASSPNYLAVNLDHPAQGWLAGLFTSRRWPFGLPGLPLPFTPSWLRKLAQVFVFDDAKKLEMDVCAWHTYRIELAHGGVRWLCDGVEVFQSQTLPRLPLGLVIWIDNQYAAWTPEGKIAFGTLPNPACQLELRIA
jgi:hypothetical protein